MLHTSIDIGIVLGIGISRGQYNWILGALLGIVLTLVHNQTKAGSNRHGTDRHRIPFHDVITFHRRSARQKCWPPLMFHTLTLLIAERDDRARPLLRGSVA